MISTVQRGSSVLHLDKAILIVSNAFVVLYENILMLPFGFLLGFLTTLTCTMSPLVCPTVSMVTQMKSFLLTMPAPRDTPVRTTVLPLSMPISCMISPLEGLVLVSFLFSTKLLFEWVSKRQKTIETATYTFRGVLRFTLVLRSVKPSFTLCIPVPIILCLLEIG
jgi:hypothetical protein